MMEQRVIRIPEGTTVIKDEAYMDNLELEEVILPDSVIRIGRSAFKGCKNLKRITLSKNLRILEEYAFSECESLEEFEIPEQLHYYARGVFSNCTNLKRIYQHEKIGYIDDFALYNCKNLEDFKIPKSVMSLGKKALMGCEKIREIHVPQELSCIEVGALAKMSSLEKITADENNERFFTDEDDTVLISKDGLIVQYAIHSPQEEFIAGYYSEVYELKSEEEEIIQCEGESVIYNIADYAFAGAKNLKKLCMASEIESIGGNTFQDCPNLKELEIFHSTYGDTFLLNVFKSFNEKTNIPFEKFKIGENIITLCENLSDLFQNATEVELPESLEHIGGNTFNRSTNLKNIKIPKSVKMIGANAFYDDTELDFESFPKIMGKDFEMLQTKTSTNYYAKTHNRDNIQMFLLKDNTYYVKIDNYETVKISKDEINSLSSSSFLIEDNPDKVIDYILELLSINASSSQIMYKIFRNKSLRELFEKFATDSDYITSIAERKTAKIIQEIIEVNRKEPDDFLFSYLVMCRFSKEEIQRIIENYNPSITRFFKLMQGDMKKAIELSANRFIIYTSLLEKYQVRDRFLYNPIFVQKLDREQVEMLIKNFNKNIKRVIENSEVLNDSYGENLSDLINLCNALGVFAEDQRISQQVCMFMTERMLCERLPNGEKNQHPVIGDEIHTIFEGLLPRKVVDYEFVKFFIKNYEQLIELEKKRPGINADIYNSFREISRTSTSHRGSQRHLEVTVEKCLAYFNASGFSNITEENKELANFLRKYYTEEKVLHIGEMIVNQSMSSPRNIFSKIEYDKCGDLIYTNDPTEDLVEKNSGFTYEWLPKQDYENLVLGKHCGCCAHLLGAGAGIMRASMISEDCQNLVIKNEEREIIGKMTLYVNRKEGYGVFNTAEIQYEYRGNIDVYWAFMRGVQAFIEKYNQNNDHELEMITIGEYRNTLVEYLNNVEAPLLETPNYGRFGYYVGDVNVGRYEGDSKKKQILVYKKEI